ncbi:Arylsulfatase A [Catalinimonas alkaloidigena]|uniref:Arylsulfatase A n=1 Tax=Catalinimonas alkaloidigena TaxID=1075417 RepID=A0A1G9N2K1_9BACT|nr:sulfatase [Catalinimonas alkaloidigena]SDL80357.1 Arylsulfatase A [Catalinimonas alkaloidigena]
MQPLYPSLPSRFPLPLFFLLLSVGWLSGCQSESGGAAAGETDSLQLAPLTSAGAPRNVIFILSDDHRYDFMSFMNNMVPWLETPNLDRIAREGAHLKNAFVSTALCSPSRASILTGQYAHVHTVVDNSAPVPDGLTFFPQYLQKANYQTGFFGKWHMGEDRNEPRPGFDRWVSFRGQGVYYNPTINVDGSEVQHGDSAYISEVLTDYALDFLKQRDKDKPFFVYLSHKAVHAEFDPAQQDHYKYHGNDIDYPASINYTKPGHIQDEEGVNYDDMPEWLKRQRYSWHGVDYAYHGQFNMDTILYRYCETLYSMDRSIGRVLDYLDQEGLAESTLVIYMGDNGFQFGEHGIIDKRTAYEASMRVPMLARCPDLIQPGTTVESVVQGVDVGPTILSAAGLSTPENMNGQSFLSVLQGDTAHWPNQMYYEYYWESAFPQTPTIFAVRTGRYKYIYNWGVWDPNELYDLQTDPDEVNNLIKSPQHQDIALGLKQDLWNWLETTDGMQIPLKVPPMKRLDHEYRGYY